MSNITKIHYQDKELVLIGTAHVSAFSVLEVNEVIMQENPDTICIELDQSRYDSITSPNRWQQLDIKEVIKQKKVPYLLVNIILSSFQNKMAKQTDSSSGQEMLEGIKLAKELNAHLVLADRDIKTTFMRVYRSLSFWEKIKMLSSIIVSVFDKSEISSEDIERMKDQDMLNQALDEITKEFPNIKKTLVDERDQYLTYKLQNAPGKKVVAILGAAHTVGIKKMISKPQSIEGLDDVPPASKFGKIFAWSIPITILSMLVISFIRNPTLGMDQLITFVLLNGGAAALGCLLMLAHPITIIASFFIAPITTLTPIVGVGWFSALIEAMIANPKVKDFENLMVDTQTLKGFFKNRVVKILLIFIVANLFSAIATYASGANIFSALIKN